jgi:hypothetical protein
LGGAGSLDRLARPTVREGFEVKEEFPQGGEAALFVAEEIAALVKRTEILEEEFEGTNIKVVADQNVPIAENAKAQKFTADLLNAHPNLAGIIASSDTVVDSDIAKVAWLAAGEIASSFTRGEIEEKEREYTPGHRRPDRTDQGHVRRGRTGSVLADRGSLLQGMEELYGT